MPPTARTTPSQNRTNDACEARRWASGSRRRGAGFTRATPVTSARMPTGVQRHGEGGTGDGHTPTVRSRPPVRRITGPGVVLGLGLGGFVDGIVLHQVLQWHHMRTGEGTLGERSMKT